MFRQVILFIWLTALFWYGSNGTAIKNHLKSSEDIIDLINGEQSLWKAERNYLSNSTLKAVQRRLGFKSQPNSFDHSNKNLLRDSSFEKLDDLPKEFDSRLAWPECADVIGHISDQGSCGSCWAVAMADAASDRLCIASKGKFKVQLSVLDLMQCCEKELCGDPGGCEGGDSYSAWQYFAQVGLVTGGAFASKLGCKPYSFAPCEHHVNGSRPKCDDHDVNPPLTCERRCTNQQFKGPYSSDFHSARNFYQLDGTSPNIEQLIQREIMTRGPVVAAVNVFNDFLHYQSGVYFKTQHAGKLLGGHAIRIIGWGVEKSKGREMPYYICANSWNTDWGDKGLFKIKRGSDECQIESFQISAGNPKI